MDDGMTKETVTVFLTCYAQPQLIAPKGRWKFELHGRGFELSMTRIPLYSPEAAEKAARRMCERLGWKVRRVEQEESTRDRY